MRARGGGQSLSCYGAPKSCHRPWVEAGASSSSVQADTVHPFARFQERRKKEYEERVALEKKKEEEEKKAEEEKKRNREERRRKEGRKGEDTAFGRKLDVNYEPPVPKRSRGLLYCM